MDSATAARRRRFRLLAMMLPLVALLAVEGALRVAGYEAPIAPAPYAFANPAPGRTEPEDLLAWDARLFWRPRPESTSADGLVRIGKSGFRTEFDAQKPPGIRRIVCLGDSSTMGVMVEANEPWPAVLEAQFLRDGARDIEVLNLGVPGYSSHQGRLLLDDLCTTLEPDDVIVAFGAFNDWVPARGHTDLEQGDPPFWHALRVLQLGAGLAGRRAPALTEEERRPTDLRGLETVDLAGPRRVPLDQFVENLRAMHATASAAGSRFAILSEPLPPDTVERNPISVQYREACRALAGELGVPFVDGWAAFENCQLHDHPLFLDFCHPTPNGHRLLARAVHAALARE